MAACYNEITGSKMISGIPSKEYKDNYDLIFGSKDKKKNDEKQEEFLKELEEVNKIEINKESDKNAK